VDDERTIVDNKEDRVPMSSGSSADAPGAWRVRSRWSGRPRR
jgi:hypothetical protein